MANDWFSPVFGYARGLPADRNERLTAILQEEFACPANDENYQKVWTETEAVDSYGDWPDPTNLRVNSYSAPFTLHVFESTGVGYAATGVMHTRTLVGAEGRALGLPLDYRFRLSQVGQPSQKVCAMDGTRYIRNGIMSFNIDAGWQSASYGTIFTNRSPAIRQGNDTANGCPYKVGSGNDLTTTTAAGKHFAYRHNETMNMVFLDGVHRSR